MKVLKILMLSLIVTGLIFSFAFAAGNAEKGKAMFNDPKAFGGKAACSSCHPAGKGLEMAADKKEWKTPAGKTKTIEEAVNLCIVNANKGKALDVKSEQMADMVAFIKSLAKKAEAPAKEMPKKQKAAGY
jgi:cytochrome c553